MKHLAWIALVSSLLVFGAHADTIRPANGEILIRANAANGQAEYLDNGTWVAFPEGQLPPGFSFASHEPRFQTTGGGGYWEDDCYCNGGYYPPPPPQVETQVYVEEQYSRRVYKRRVVVPAGPPQYSYYGYNPGAGYRPYPAPMPPPPIAVPLPAPGYGY